MEGHEKALLYQPGRALTRNHTGHSLDPELPASNNYYENKLLLSKPPSLSLESFSHWELGIKVFP